MNQIHEQSTESSAQKRERLRRNAKQRKKLNLIRSILTLGIRVFFFFVFPAVFATAFSGIKYLMSQFSSGAALQINSFLVTLLILVAFTIVFGRFFCGYACAFGSYGDALYWVSSKVRRRFRKKPLHFPEKLSGFFRYGKYIVLVVVVLMCFFGASNAVSSASPWGVFSRLQSLKLPAAGTGLGIFFFILISIGMLAEPRFFCRFLCPMGAVFSLLPIAPFSSVKRTQTECLKGCKICKNNCPCSLDIPHNDIPEEDGQKMGECFQCGRCVTNCPSGSAKAGTMRAGIPGILWLIVKAAILAGFCWWLTTLTI